MPFIQILLDTCLSRISITVGVNESPDEGKMSFQKRIFEEFKKQNNCFLNWPATRKISLGDYCTFDGWNAAFSWHGNIAKAGIEIAEISSKGQLDEQYTSSGSASIKFSASQGSGSTAEIAFRSKSSLAYQTKQGKTKFVHIDAVLSEMLDKIHSGKLEWRPEYIIVTEVLEAKSFSSFVSCENGASVKIVAPGVAVGAAFNIADTDLKLAVQSQSGMGYVSLATKDAFPYFVGHRLINQGGRYRLKRYASSIFSS